MSDDAMSYIVLASQAKGEQQYTNMHLKFRGMYPTKLCIMPVVDGFGLAVDVSGLLRNQWNVRILK